jgi:diaminopimelate epimerase
MGLPKVYAESTATVSGREYPGTAVDVGNPHLVCPVEDLSTLDLSRPPGYDTKLFPNGVNVEFVAASTVDSGTLRLRRRMRVHERGVGETLSCGSGVVAVAAVALRDARRDTGTVVVDVPGGRLKVRFDGQTCWLSGPAVIVARGQITLPGSRGRRGRSAEGRSSAGR